MRALSDISVRIKAVVGGRPCSVEACHRTSQYRGADESPVCECHYKRWRKANPLPDRACIVCEQPFRPRGQKLTCSKDCGTKWQISWRRRLKAVPEGKIKAAQDQRRLRDSDEYRAKRYAYESTIRDKKLAKGRERTKRPEVKLRRKMWDFVRNNSPEGKEKMRARRAAYVRTPAGQDAVKRGCRKRRARMLNVECTPYSANAIFARDKYVCMLCGDPVSKKAKWPHPLSPSVDHIVPLAAGGADVPHNVQCAHLRCNLRKSAVPRGQMILEGFGL